VALRTPTRCALALLLVCGMLVAPPLAAAQAAVTKAQAIAIVKKVLRAHADACELEIISVTARKIAAGWRVYAKVSTFGNVGTSQWTVKGKKAVPGDQLAFEIAHDCF